LIHVRVVYFVIALDLSLRQEAQFYNADAKLLSIWPHESYRGFCQF